jgi:hypothetical protein
LSIDRRAAAQARWEYGSQFHWQRLRPDMQQGVLPWATQSVRLGCGRDALRVVVERTAPLRLWFPSYLCQELVTPFVGSDVELCCYPDSPLEASLDLRRIELRPRDAIVVVNYFGLAARARVLATDVQGVTIVEDHTHDPCSTWAQTSQADYCFASLRKSVPVPDGAVLWSPLGRALPEVAPLRPEQTHSIQQLLSGMLMKALYLDGHRVSKPAFRQLLSDGEERIAHGTIAAMSQLSSAVVDGFPFEDWRRARRNNFLGLATGLRGAESFEVVEPSDPQAAPFAAFCVFQDADRCAAAHSSLVDRDVYPSRLWPLEKPALEGIPDEHVRLARRAFALPCDARYGPGDIVRVIDAFRSADLV